MKTPLVTQIPALGMHYQKGQVIYFGFQDQTLWQYFLKPRWIPQQWVVSEVLGDFVEILKI